MDNLTKDCILMKQLGYGCHYGQYKADHPGSVVISSPKIEIEEDASKLCAGCGKRFFPSRKGQKYCEPQCRSRNHYKRLKAKKPVVMVKCPVCGDEFEKGYSRKYCSERCRKERNHARR